MKEKEQIQKCKQTEDYNGVLCPKCKRIKSVENMCPKGRIWSEV